MHYCLEGNNDEGNGWHATEHHGWASLDAFGKGVQEYRSIAKGLIQALSEAIGDVGSDDRVNAEIADPVAELARSTLTPSASCARTNCGRLHPLVASATHGLPCSIAPTPRATLQPFSARGALSQSTPM
jgi:hypothetical protein